MKKEQWIFVYLRSHRLRFLLVIGLGILTAGCAAALMFTSGFLISKSALRPENILMVYVPIVLVRTFGIGRAVLHYAERLISHDMVLRILAKMRVRLYRILEPQALFLRSRYRTGDMLGTLADDIEQLQDVYVRTIFPTVTAVVIYGLAVAALGTFDLSFALWMALYLFFLVVLLPLVSLWMTQVRQRRMRKSRNRLYRKWTDAVMGLSDWVISGRTAELIASHEADEARLAGEERRLKRWKRWRTLAGQCMLGILVIFMVSWAGGQTQNGQLAAPMIAAFTLIVFPLMDVFLPVSEAVEKIPQYRHSLKRIHRFERSGVVPSTEPGVAEEELQKAKQKADIRLKKVSHRYEGADEWSVDNISLDIPHGKKVALIGRSGAGKSTLIKLIQGVLAPDRGQVTINGVEAVQFGGEISKVISVLNQRPHLFDTTVANNIRLGKPDATDEEVRQVARQVRLDALIESLPLGYDTPMLETGERFSGGERQRIALARILLQNTPVMILDEPTVGLDPRTERDLLATIFQVAAGKTLIWITHHLTGVEKMDEVVFIENGRIEMIGPHEELLACLPRYRRLYHLDRPVMPEEAGRSGR